MAAIPPVCDFGWKAPGFDLPATDRNWGEVGAGIRIGGESKNRRAVKVWDKREFKDLDDDVELVAAGGPQSVGELVDVAGRVDHRVGGRGVEEMAVRISAGAGLPSLLIYLLIGVLLVTDQFTLLNSYLLKITPQWLLDLENGFLGR